MGFKFEKSPRPVANLKANDNQYVTDGTNNTPVKYHTILIHIVIVKVLKILWIHCTYMWIASFHITSLAMNGNWKQQVWI